MFDELNNDNIMMYAVKAYDKPNCIMSEFKEDMKRFNYLKRLFKRYRKYDELREQLEVERRNQQNLKLIKKPAALKEYEKLGATSMHQRIQSIFFRAVSKR